jgi:hypothetical protein
MRFIRAIIRNKGLNSNIHQRNFVPFLHFNLDLEYSTLLRKCWKCYTLNIPNNECMRCTDSL